MKKVVGGLVVLVVFILLISLTVGSPNQRSTKPVLAATTKAPPRLPAQDAPRASSTTPSAHAPITPQTITKQPSTQAPDFLIEHLNLRACRACALVGDSQALLGSNAGSRIDSKQCVFRLDTSPTVRFEEDVGSKTTVRIFTMAGLTKLVGKVRQTFAQVDSLRAVVVMGTKRQLCANCTAVRMLKNLERYFEGVKFLAVTPSNFPAVFGTGSALRSGSSGAVALMKGICQEIRVYGVHRGDRCNRGSYWDPEPLPQGCKEHVSSLNPGGPQRIQG